MSYVKRALLPKGMPGPPPTPKPRLIDIKDDYVDVKSRKKDESTSAGKSLVRSLDTGTCEGRMEPSEIHSRLAGLAIPALKELAPALRQLYLQRLSGMSREPFQEYKHVRVLQSAYTALANDFTSIAVNLNNIALGTGVNQRLGDHIRCKRLIVKVGLARYNQANATVAYQHNMITWSVFRDKLPTTPGTMPAFFATDTNPPTSTTAVISGCGLAQNTSLAGALGSRNPNTALDYHIYTIKHREEKQVEMNSVVLATAVGMPTLFQEIHTEIIPLHDLDIQFQAGGAGTTAVVNQLWFTAGCSIAAATQLTMGYSDQIGYNIDLEFESEENSV